jgi:hypothetical protein
MEETMKSKSRKAVVVGAWVTAAALGGTALTGVALAAGSGPGSSPTGASASTASAASTTGTAGGAAGARAARLRALGKNVLHGEFTVQTKNGVKVLDTEIGVITEVTPTSVAVKASDGYAQTWTLDSSTHVRANGHKGSIADLKVGETVRLLGPTSGGTATAQLALVRPTP